MRNLANLFLLAFAAALLIGLARFTAAQDDEDEIEGTDDVFIPTEEIPADEEITFPVNI